MELLNAAAQVSQRLTCADLRLLTSIRRGGFGGRFMLWRMNAFPESGLSIPARVLFASSG
jgi:hypothetical protein